MLNRLKQQQQQPVVPHVEPAGAELKTPRRFQLQSVEKRIGSSAVETPPNPLAQQKN